MQIGRKLFIRLSFWALEHKTNVDSQPRKADSRNDKDEEAKRKLAKEENL